MNSLPSFVINEIWSGMNLYYGELFSFAFCFATLSISKGIQLFRYVLLWLGPQNYKYD